MTPYDYPVLGIAFTFLLAQGWGLRLLKRREWLWLAAGLAAYWGVAWLFNIAIDTRATSLVFLGLVVLNLLIVFSGRFPHSGRLVFVDMTLCFCLSYLFTPGRLMMFSFSLSDPESVPVYYWYSEYRILDSTIINAVCLATLVVTYWVASRLKFLGLRGSMLPT